MSNIVPFQEMQGMAEAIAKSGLFGMKDTNSVLALMAVAQAEGLHPATAARDYHIIQGRPALKADAMLARFQAAGGKVDWKIYTDQNVTGIFTHPNGGSLELSWTLEQANKIGLNKPGSGWAKYPRAMLRARVVSEGIRTVYPGCVIGTYTPEEVEDFDTPKTEKFMGRGEVNITPPPVTIENLREDPVSITVDVEPSAPTYALMLPDGTIYSKHEEIEGWIAAYADLFVRIRDSAKIKEEEKHAKIDALKKANYIVLGVMSAVQKSQVLAAIAPKGVQESPKEHGSQSTTEAEVTMASPQE